MKKLNLWHLIITVFILSWTGILPSLLRAYEIPIPKGLENLEILMTIGPLLGAVIYIFKMNGKQGLKAFFSRLLGFKAPLGVLLVTFLLPFLISFVGSWMGLSLSESAWPDSFTPITIMTNGLVIFLMYLVLNTEELVWRGLVFDQFLDKYGYFKSCLLLIPIWWLFHIPLFLFPEGHPAGYGLGIFTCIVIAQTFILGWIYVKSNRSLFYVHMHHQLINGFGQAFPIFPVFVSGNMLPVWVFSLLLLLTAGFLIFQMRGIPKSQKKN
ncbi:MAG: CPBP family intramembrane metalloprotease [Bacteroidia bacterium]|nr:CPBP family intramembrane metalloprotease [Bacteroidia bacterium]